MKVEKPLRGSGYLQGTVDGTLGTVISFLTTTPVDQLSFHGRRDRQRISGKYTVIRFGQDGDFELEKISSEVSDTQVDANKCSVD
jgi:hypothetical protein